MQNSEYKIQETISKFGKSEKDSGSVEVQVVIFTNKIKHLTSHLKSNRKDFNTTRSLTKLSGKRKKLLKYLQHTDLARYRKLIDELGLKK